MFWFEFRLPSKQSFVGLLSMSLQNVGCLKPDDDLVLARFSQLEICVILVFYAEDIVILLLQFQDNLSVWTHRLSRNYGNKLPICA